MSKCGWSVEAYHPRTLASTATADIPRRIKSKEFDKLWLDLPNVKRAIAPRRCTAVLNDVASWMNAALEAKVAAYLSGVRGRHWQEAPIASLAGTKQYYEADFALCRFDISTGEDPGTKSSLQIHVLSTCPMKAMKCNCGEGVPHEHGSDKIKGVGRRRVRAVALKQVQQQVMKKVLGSALTDCFPVSTVEETSGPQIDSSQTECEEQSKPDITQAGGPTETNSDFNTDTSIGIKEIEITVFLNSKKTTLSNRSLTK